MRKPWLIVAVLLGMIGVIWFGQGIGLIGGSVMTNDTKWAVIGGILLGAAAAILFRERRRRLP